ncbi:MAG TPA: molybdopterin cofactor-binding domain-containing protein [Terriglobales bacterium]|nr:molybdopterin cofactor-binding domain-containing protein [Terriglobales bacterium]
MKKVPNKKAAEPLPPQNLRLPLTVNGETHEWQIAAGDLLLDVLRREGYYGVKRGCETGECGACTVLLDGKPINSCMMFAAQANGHNITTVEALARNGRLHDIQQALVDHGAVQCGFCTPGLVLTAEAFLAANPNPTEQQITEAISGSLCRCTGYKKPVEALLAASRHEKCESACTDHEHTVLGHSLQKVDAVKLASGRPAFTDDISIPGLLIGKILPSPHAHARITHIDTRKAKALPGVHAVLTYKDVPRVPHTTAGQAWPEPSPYDTYLLDNKVRFVGDRVAAVAAESRAIAEEALRLIEVEYNLLPPVLDMERAQESAVIHDEPDSTGIHDAQHNIAAEIHKYLGDVEQGFRESDLFVEREFRTQREQHAMLEPHVTITWLDPDDRLVIRSSTQIPFHVRRQVAMVLQIPLQRIHVVKPRIGGGFGGKQEMVLEDICGALTLATRRPVKIEYTRKEEFFMGRSRHPQVLRMKMGFKNDGTIVANQMSVLASTGAYGSHSATVQGNTGSKVLPLYRAANMKFDCQIVYTNTPVAGAFRGYGCPQGFFAQEGMIDEVAEQLHIDPLELRRKNLIRQGDTDELSAQLGEGRKGLARLMRSCGIVECMERGAAAIGWKELRKPKNTRKSHLRRGAGMACSMQGSGIAGVDWASATIKLNENGSYQIHAGAADVGAGADTVLTQIAAETLGVTPDMINICSGDTDSTPFDVGAYASSTTIISGGAVKKAAEKVRQSLLQIASTIVNVPVEKLTCTNNQIMAEDGHAWLLADIARQITYKEKVQVMESASHFNMDSPPPFCATFTEVEVDVETGKVRVLHLVTAVDCGKAINPRLAEGQVEGAVAQGIGYALTEEMLLDEYGQMLNANFLDYKIMTAKDMPKITTILVETDEPLGPYGAKSIGEVAINGPAPAIANALYEAIGIRFRKLPIRAEDVLRAIHEKEKTTESFAVAAHHD